MQFHIIDLDSWKRKDYYEHYMNAVRCNYSVTLNLDIDTLVKRVKSLGLKAYPVHIYMIAKIVNSFTEFRMALAEEGRPGYWDVSNPSYTIFNKAAESFSSIYTPYENDFSRFYESCLADMETYRESETLFPQAAIPENIFTISSLPWISFTGFTLNVYGEGGYLPPIFTLGRYLEQNGKKHLPLSIQVHHAVCDGYHVGKFAEALQDMAVNFDKWL